MFNDHVFYFIQLGVVMFWALWWTIVLCTDGLDFLKEKGFISPKWTFSNNYQLIQRIFFRFGVLRKNYLVDIVYVLIILGVLVINVLYWIAFFTDSRTSRSHYIVLAFAVSFLMDAAFILFDELVIEYDLGHNHKSRAVFRIVTFFLCII